MASRRYLARTSDSLLSVASGLRVEVVRTDDLFDQLTDAHDQQSIAPDLTQEQRELSEWLTMNAIVRTNSVATQMNNHAQIQHDLDSFVSIGAGACGCVFTQLGRPIALKIQKNWAETHNLYQEGAQHLEILSSLERYPIANIKIPALYDYKNLEEASLFFKEHPQLAERASSKANLPMPLLISDRIMPLPEPIRERLITVFCPPKLQEYARSDVENKDCLVRVYLGQDRRTSTPGSRPARFFTLRNFKLYLNDMEMLQLDTEALAFTMGQTLAVLHYVAQTDARDVEFVLGSTTQRKVMRMEELRNKQHWTRDDSASDIQLKHLLDYSFRKTELYLLDFNQCRPISQDENGVAQAVTAYLNNDPYFPRPFRNTRRGILAWHSFAAAYLDQAQCILRDEEKLEQLACEFLRRIRKHYKEKYATAAARAEGDNTSRGLEELALGME